MSRRSTPFTNTSSGCPTRCRMASSNSSRRSFPRSRRRSGRSSTRAARTTGVPPPFFALIPQSPRKTLFSSNPEPNRIPYVAMHTSWRLALAACLFAAAAGSGCASAPSSHLHQTLPGLGQLPYSDADVEFMSGMIPHHAQAVVMAGWAPSHGARHDVAVLCERIVVGQRDEIEMMRTWLAARGLAVPDATATRHKMTMDGTTHEMLMPGMLTDEEMAQLDRARGPEFDRLFLTGMIKHHQGAIDMVDTLFKSYGAAQDETIYKFASDVYADQSTEIDRMYQMLEHSQP